MRLGIKICGVCRPEEAALASEAGADYVGVILSAQGPRHRDPQAAAEIFAAARARRAGVFVDEPLERVLQLARRLSLDVIQLHGREAPEYVAALRRPGAWRVWKALRVREGQDTVIGLERYGGYVDALLLDLPRGVAEEGIEFDWQTIAEAIADEPRPRIWVAGGLRPGNVARVVRTLAPDGVDVSSGVESAPGRKSIDEIAAFVAAARAEAPGTSAAMSRRRQRERTRWDERQEW